MKNLTGRPQLPPEKKKSEAISFAVTKKEHDKIRDKAEEAGVTVSHYCRKKALGAR